MKAVIRGDKGVFELALFAENYDDAILECRGLLEDGIIKVDDEVISIIE